MARWAGFHPTVVVADTCDVIDDQIGTHRVLLHRAGGLNRIGKSEQRTVHAGHFGRAGPYFAIVDP